MTGVQTCALRSEEHTSELQSHDNLVCRLLVEKKRVRPGGRHAERVAVADHTDLFPGTVARVGRADVVRPGGLALGGRELRVRFFFFMVPAPPEISPLPLPAPLRT